jgi:hypothetical protein
MMPENPTQPGNRDGICVGWDIEEGQPATGLISLNLVCPAHCNETSVTTTHNQLALGSARLWLNHDSSNQKARLTRWEWWAGRIFVNSGALQNKSTATGVIF